MYLLEQNLYCTFFYVLHSSNRTWYLTWGIFTCVKLNTVMGVPRLCFLHVKFNLVMTHLHMWVCWFISHFQIVWISLIACRVAVFVIDWFLSNRVWLFFLFPVYHWRRDVAIEQGCHLVSVDYDALKLMSIVWRNIPV